MKKGKDDLRSSLLLKIVAILTVIIVVICTTSGVLSYNKSAKLNSRAYISTIQNEIQLLNED